MIHPAFKKDYIVKNFDDVNADHIAEKIIQELDEMNTNNLNSSGSSHLPHLSLFYDEESEADLNDSKQLLETYFLESDKSLAVLLQQKYAKIKEVFLKHNTQLLSSASFERLFSIAKHVLTYSRTSLADERFEKLVILISASKWFFRVSWASKLQ